MPDLTAKRTLVKSPPELWEELSEVDRLAKHLGAFGEITITKLEPEHTVAWEGEHASGTVSIEPSGWGTKVTLRAELPETEEEPVAAEPEPEAPADDSTEAQHVDDQIRRFRVEPDAEARAASPEAQHIGQPEGDQRVELPPEPTVRETDPGPAPEPAPVAEPAADADAETPERAPRRGFWGWLFRSRTEPIPRESKPVAAEPKPTAAEPEPEPIAAEPEPEPVAAEPDSEPVAAEPDSEPIGAAAEAEPIAAEPEPGPIAAEPEPEPVAAEPEPVAAEPEPAPVVGESEPDPEPAPAAPDVQADALGDAAALDPERVRVILDEALDALGAAHHRPFSRG
jgi:hypothetical protein